jgi:RNA polymerase sigma factor (sigma-70 family)
MGSLAETSTGEAQLYERHSELVYGYCLRMLRSREDAEDASQTTFIQAVRALRRGVVPAFEQAWLLTIAKNECRSRYRASKRRRELELARDPKALEEVAPARESGDDLLIGVQAALARMPEMQRRALLLREWQGHSYAEIAEELQLSQGAVEALLFRARKSLAQQLGEERRARKHALDLASLLGGLKSLLGGGTAIKATAVGLAAVASVGVAVGRSHVASPPAKQQRAGVVAPTQNAVAPQRSARTTSAAGGAARGTVSPVRHRASAPGSRPTAPRSSPAAPAAPTGAAPQPPPAGAQPSAPSTPAVPQAPKVEAPKAPALPVEVPQVPQVQTPQLPQVPSLPPPPPVPELPQVPDVQVPDVPDLPKLP